jgi:hypothetical protein
MEEVAAIVNQLRVLRRRYWDGCLGQQTVTVRSGSASGNSSGVGVGAATGRSHTTYSDQRRNVVGYGEGRSDSGSVWFSSRAWSDSWREVSAIENASTPECRMIASDIIDLAPRVTRAMAEAEQEAVRQGIWTWLQTDVPQKLAIEIWR